MVARGEVWWYEHPRAGRRPFLILTRTEAVAVLNQVLAVPATTTVRGIPTEVGLDRADGMPTACVLSLDNVALIRPAFCTKRITTLSSEKLMAVCDALRHATAC
ncbi:MAG: type II toxin-antitoxin system PemK/MazF family toxin [Acidimicrobiia bacterium]